MVVAIMQGYYKYLSLTEELTNIPSDIGRRTAMGINKGPMYHLLTQHGL